MNGDYIVITITKPVPGDSRHAVTAQNSNGFYVLDAKCRKDMAAELVRICTEWFTKEGNDVSL